jgi:hypothetical protein
MGARHAQMFESLRPDVLGRLVEVRASIDHSYAALPDEVIRAQFDQVLDRMQAYLEERDHDKYRGFLHRWMALRTGEGFTAENLVYSVVALGDVVAQLARHRLKDDPEVLPFVLQVVKMTHLAARLIVESLAEELERRQEQLAHITLGGRP